jgi:hypothetical protein
MISIKFDAVNKYVGAILLIGTGILLILFVVTIAGEAVPSGSYISNPDFLKDSPPSYQYSSLDSNVQPPMTLVFDSSPIYHQTAVLYIARWSTKPIKSWSLIAAASLVFIGILYLLLKRVHSGMSEEIFP